MPIKVTLHDITSGIRADPIAVAEAVMKEFDETFGDVREMKLLDFVPVRSFIEFIKVHVSAALGGLINTVVVPSRAPVREAEENKVISQANDENTAASLSVMTTRLSKAANVGESKLEVLSEAGFVKGMHLEIGEGSNKETAILKDFGSLVLESPLTRAHPKDTSVKGYLRSKAPMVNTLKSQFINSDSSSILVCTSNGSIDYGNKNLLTLAPYQKQLQGLSSVAIIRNGRCLGFPYIAATRFIVDVLNEMAGHPVVADPNAILSLTKPALMAQMQGIETCLKDIEHTLSTLNNDFTASSKVVKASLVTSSSDRIQRMFDYYAGSYSGNHSIIGAVGELEIENNPVVKKEEIDDAISDINNQLGIVEDLISSFEHVSSINFGLRLEAVQMLNLALLQCASIRNLLREEVDALVSQGAPDLTSDAISTMTYQQKPQISHYAVDDLTRVSTPIVVAKAVLSDASSRKLPTELSQDIGRAYDSFKISQGIASDGYQLSISRRLIGTYC